MKPIYTPCNSFEFIFLLNGNNCSFWIPASPPNLLKIKTIYRFHASGSCTYLFCSPAFVTPDSYHHRAQHLININFPLFKKEFPNHGETKDWQRAIEAFNRYAFLI